VNRRSLRVLLGKVRAGKLGVDEALLRLRGFPVEEIGFATLDMHRALRKGFPEVVYGPGKSVEQLTSIVDRMHRSGQDVLVTRVAPEVYKAIAASHPRAEWHGEARAVVLRSGRKRRGRPGLLVLTAGTSDIPVAEEAALTAELMGSAPARIYDVGVAGLHRLMAHREALLRANVIVVVAGMEGALPSVVAGLVSCPVIGVPTSTGYGAGRAGEAALLAMLNSCAPGLSVVNIDNGFGAGYMAALIHSRTTRNRPPK
jgi:pyridinium-3,5-biscarboxylic acid mononucleotide synthase